MKPILVGTFVALVILSECLFAYFLIPSTAEVEKWASDKAAASAKAAPVGKHGHGGDAASHGEPGHADHPGHDHSAHAIEVELGKFNVVIHQPAANLTMRVNFHLIATLPE